MADNYFQVDKINVKYGDIQVLWDVSLEAAMELEKVHL